MILPPEALPYLLNCREDNVDEWALEPNDCPLYKDIHIDKSWVLNAELTESELNG